jgi:hypothetical protein
MIWRGGLAHRPMRLTARTAERGMLPLYPTIPPGNTWLLCAGEFDALAAIQAGLPAVTGLIGAKWHHTWDSHAVGKRIAVCYDVGEEEAAARTVDRLNGLFGVVEAWSVELTGPDGYDLCDFFKEGHTAEDLLKRIRKAKP